MRTCTRCLTAKAFTAFGFRPERNSFRSHCKDCSAAEGRQWRAKNPATARRATQRWRASNPEAVLRIERRKGYKRTSGLTLEAAEALLASQGFRCANRGCNAELSRGRGPSSATLDHHHGSRTARAFLCSACNKGLGFLKEDPYRMRGLAEYVEFHHAKVPGRKA